MFLDPEVSGMKLLNTCSCSQFRGKVDNRGDGRSIWGQASTVQTVLRVATQEEESGSMVREGGRTRVDCIGGRTPVHPVRLPETLTKLQFVVITILSGSYI